MRHRVVKNKLSRDQDHMKSLVKNLATELITHEKIETTLAKARIVRPVVEKLVTLAKKSTAKDDKIAIYNAVKTLNTKLTDEEATKKLLSEMGNRFKDVNGGYTRITKLPNRDGDNSEMARIEFTKSAAKKKAKSAKLEKAETNE